MAFIKKSLMAALPVLATLAVLKAGKNLPVVSTVRGFVL